MEIAAGEKHIPTPDIQGMTRSQRVFSVATGIDPRTLTFSRSDSGEFFLFMRLRDQLKWASFRMSPFDWICATHAFNTEIEMLNQKDLRTVRSLKVPRALMEKLGDVERDILARLSEQNFVGTSASSYTSFMTYSDSRISQPKGPGKKISGITIASPLI